MQFTALEIAKLLNGTVEGNPDVTVNNLSKIEEGKPNTLSFLSNPLYGQFLYTTNASVVIIAKNFVPEKTVKSTCTLIKVDDPRQAFSLLLDTYNQMKIRKTGIEPQSHVSATARLGDKVYVGAFTYVGENVKIGNNVMLYPNVFIGDNAEIGDDTIIYSGVKIYHECKVGKSCIIQAGTVIGGDGFGFQPNTENNYYKIPHIGNVIIEDHVEIGANTTVDRATLGSTIIRKGVKLDNLIQIGHNAEIGENTIIVAQSGVAGSTIVGRDCMIGGQVGIVGHISIADGVKIAAQSGVGNDIKEKGAVVQGSPAYAIGNYKRSYVMFKKLPEVQQQINELEKILKELRQIAGDK
ncbi:MAG: UDP-3-O-(3-hydroxymyristoyl)glucosamine N-acyltransferase [Bacteroidia bacterium]|nr:UDP-3-O-(3-hydroxymyristoyl)glucosamine N-acyltransferase [Bacteroidia bacterium]